MSQGFLARLVIFLFFASAVKSRTVDVNWCSVCLIRAEIETGDVVRWTNLDQETHDLVSISGDFEFTIKAKGRVKKVFRKAGKYAFYCKKKPWMKGVIIVQERRPSLYPRAPLPECVHHGKYYQSGSSIRDKCKKCLCRNGGWSCAFVAECKKGTKSTVNKTRPKDRHFTLYPRAPSPECVHNGKYYQNGSRIRVKCSRCLCRNGGWSCVVVPECKKGRKSIVKKTQSKGCRKCRRKHRISSRLLCRERYDFVIRCQIVTHYRNAGENKQNSILVVNITNVFQSPRNHTLQNGLFRLHLSPVSLMCTCPRLEYNRDYVLIGRQGSSPHAFAVTPNSIVADWSEDWRRKIRNYLRKVSRNKCGKFNQR